MLEITLTQLRLGWPTAWGVLRMEDDRAEEYLFEVEDGVLYASSPVPTDSIIWDPVAGLWVNQE